MMSRTGQTSGLLSPWLRRKRFESAAPFLRGAVLDFGCGDGSLCGYLSPVAYHGIDLSAEALAIARNQYPSARFSHDVPNDFDCDSVACLAVLEHLREPEPLLRAISARLRPGGAIVMTSPRRGFRWVHEICARIGLASLEAAEEHDHFWTPSDVSQLAARCGLKLDHYATFLFGMNQLFVLKRA